MIKSLPDPAVGTAEEKLRFWLGQEARMQALEADQKTLAVELTREILQRGRRFVALRKFDDVGLSDALFRLNVLMGLFRNFPLDQLLAATNLSQLAAAVDAVLEHVSVSHGSGVL
jgi:dynein heavy chain 1